MFKNVLLKIISIVLSIVGIVSAVTFAATSYTMKGYVSAIIFLVLAILCLPPVYAKLPNFHGKFFTSIIMYVVISFIAIIIIPERESDAAEGIVATNTTEVKEESASETPATEIEGNAITNEDETIKDDDLEEADVLASENEESGFTYEGFDELSRYDWIDKNINLCVAGEEFDYIGVEKWGADKSNEALAAFYLDWYDVISYNLNNNYNLNNLNLEENTDLLLDFCNYIQSAKYLFDAVYPDCIIVNVEIYPYIDTAVETGNKYYDSILNNQDDKYRRFFEFNSQWETVVNYFNAVER